MLFHSLFKVLFIFRSHYLFAIGLGGNIEPSRKDTREFVQQSQTARLLEQKSRGDTDSLDKNGTIALFGETSQNASSNELSLGFRPCTTIPRLQIPSIVDSSIGSTDT